MSYQKRKLNLLDLRRMKESGEVLAWITAYDYPTGYVAEKGNVDMILVGDSGGMVQLGYKTTNPVLMDEMILFAKAVRRGAPNTFLIGDMPQGSYEVSASEAVRSALRFVKEADCDAIKCEGGRRVVDKVSAMRDAGIPVIGHLGLTPQSASNFGGYSVQGKTLSSFELIFEESLALQEAGVAALLLEAMPSESAGQIAKQLTIPVYGIGAGSEVDGQLLIIHDLLGYYPLFRPKFAKCYIPQVVESYVNSMKIGNSAELKRSCRDGFLVLAESAVCSYVSEVKQGVFPSEEFVYPIAVEALTELKKSKYWKE